MPMLKPRPLGAPPPSRPDPRPPQDSSVANTDDLARTPIPDHERQIEFWRRRCAERVDDLELQLIDRDEVIERQCQVIASQQEREDQLTKRNEFLEGLLRKLGKVVR